MIKNIKIDGSGDAPNINTAILDFFQALDAYSIPADETLTVVLLDAGDYGVNYLSYYVNRLVQTRITIVATTWNTAIDMGTAVWLEWNTPLLGSYVDLEISGCTLKVDGSLLISHDQDVLIKDCRTLGTGFLVVSENGQTTLDRVIGDPLDLTIAGDPNTAARGANGGGMTFDRPALVMTHSRLGTLRTNKPVNITKCDSCTTKETGLGRYIETASYGGSPSTVKAGSFLDNVNINYGGQTGPLMTIVDGGLYRRISVKTLLGDTIAPNYALVEVASANLNMIAIDRLKLQGAPYGIKIMNGGIIDVTNSIFTDISISKIKNETCPFNGRLKLSGNRGDSITLINGCSVDCGPV